MEKMNETESVIRSNCADRYLLVPWIPPQLLQQLLQMRQKIGFGSSGELVLLFSSLCIINLSVSVA